jgi:hypothetical protein
MEDPVKKKYEELLEMFKNDEEVMKHRQRETETDHYGKKRSKSAQ